MLRHAKGDITLAYVFAFVRSELCTPGAAVARFGLRTSLPVVPLFVLILILCAFATRVPNYLSVANLQQLLHDFAEAGLIAVALGIVVLAGAIDLSVGAVFALANFLALYLFRALGWPLEAAFALVIGAGLLIGAINGLLVAYVGTGAFLTTMAVLLILRAAHDWVSDVYSTQLANATHDSAVWEFLGTGTVLGMPVNALVLVLVAVAVQLFLSRLRPGLHLMAVGAQRRAARQAGIDVDRTLLIAYVLSGSIAACAGFLYAARQNSAGSDTGQGWEVTALAALVLGGVSLSGGRGSMARVLIGAAIAFLLVNGLLRMNLSGSLSSAVIGLTLLLAVGINVRWEQGRRQHGRARRTRQLQADSVASGRLIRGGPGVADAPPAREPILRVRAACKIYGGIHALDQVDFEVLPGEIHALMGENGAGKTTLAGVIAGAVVPNSGSLSFDGKARHFHSPAESLRAGIAMVYQDSRLIPTMSVAHNLQLGRERWITRPRPLVGAARKALAGLGLDFDPAAAVETLNVAERQMVEIARALRLDARLIVFDEPSASLTPLEREKLFVQMRALRARGVAVVFVTHALEEALTLADRITVLRDGRRVACRPATELDRASLIRLMIGREPAAIYPAGQGGARARQAGPPLLSVENISLGDMLSGMSFSLHAGEVVGLAGLVGSGRSEIAMIIAGALRRDRRGGGGIRLHDKAVRYRQPADGLRDGIAYITEDRKRNGFFGNMTAEDNILLGARTAPGGWRFFYDRATGRRIADDWIARLAVKHLGPHCRVTDYSGGNQQKIVIAKALAQNPDIVLFDEPTRGVDVGAIEHIHESIRGLARAGKAIVVISSYLPEILGLSDRILVARGGRIVAEFDGTRASEEQVMAAAFR